MVVIDGVVVDPDPVPEGQGATIKINAHDSDANPIDFTAIAKDPGTGEEAKYVGTLRRVAEPLTYALEVSSGKLMQDPSDPSLFHWIPGEDGHGDSHSHQ